MQCNTEYPTPFEDVNLRAMITIKKGELFTNENIGIKRPGNGISPMRWNEIIGKVASRDYKEDQLISG